MNLATDAQCAAVASAGGRRSGRVRAALLLSTVVAAMFATAAQAGDTGTQETWPQVWINPGIYSHHFNTNKGLRNNNAGFGAEVMLSNEHVLMGGSFINSNRDRTHFAGYEWRPLHWHYSGVDVGAGIMLGAFDGYPNYRQGAWFVAPLPMLSVEGKRLGANFGLIPTIKDRFDGALAIQVKLRVW